jgi:hypothetical protein
MRLVGNTAARREHPMCGFERQSAFADPARTGERDHPIGREAIQQIAHRLLPPH